MGLLKSKRNSVTLRRIVHKRDFSGEMITNIDQADRPENASRLMENSRGDVAGRWRGIPGFKLKQTGPGGGVTIEWIDEVVLNNQQILLAWGNDGSSVQHFYFHDGTNWVEITEVFQTTIASSASSTSITLTSDGGQADDYYNKWWIFVDTDTTMDYVLTHVGDVITTKDGMGVVTGNVTLMRFPLFNSGDIYGGSFSDHRNFVSNGFKPSIVQRRDAVAILTGRKKDTVSKGVDNHSNLWLGHIDRSNKDYFDDADLDFTGFHAERRFLDSPLEIDLFFSITNSTNTADPLPDNKVWIFKLSLIYDGYQESPIFFLNTSSFVDGTNAKDLSALSNQIIAVKLEWDRFTTLEELIFHPGSRRLTAIRLYAGQAKDVGAPNFTPNTPFFFVIEKLLSDSAWTTAPYQITFNFKGSDWNQGLKREAEFNHGYFDNVRSNADLGVKVEGREIAGGIVVGIIAEPDESDSYLIPSAINSAFRNAPDTLPEGDIKDTQEESLYRIKNMQEVGSQLAVLGDDRLVLYAFNSIGKLVPVDNFSDRGLPGFFGADSTDDDLFWGSDYSIYLLRRTGQPVEIGAAIRDIWNLRTKEDAIARYHGNENEFFLFTPDNDISYIYDIGRGTWKQLDSTKTWTWLASGVDGEILTTDGTDIYELFSSAPTESLDATLEDDYEFETEVNVTQFWLNYECDKVIKISIFDLERSSTTPVIKPLLFLPQTRPVTKKVEATFTSQRIRVKIEKLAGTDASWFVNSYSIYGNPKDPTSDEKR